MALSRIRPASTKPVVKAQHLGAPGDALGRGEGDLVLGIGGRGPVRGGRSAHDRKPSRMSNRLALHRERLAEPGRPLAMNGVGHERIQQCNAQRAADVLKHVQKAAGHGQLIGGAPR